MKRCIFACIVSAYLGAGLSNGLIMAQVLPLSAFGVAFYATTWPLQIYCARPGASCFGNPTEILPLWFVRLLFDLEDAA